MLEQENSGAKKVGRWRFKSEGVLESRLLTLYESLLDPIHQGKEYTMRDRLQTRLGELKKEFVTGQARLQELERQQVHLRETMLRISGAIQVLEELLADARSVEQNGAHSGEKQPLFGQVNPGNIMDPALQTSSLGDHDQGSRQNSPTVNMLGEKE